MEKPINRRLIFTVKDLRDITGFGLVKCREIMRDMREWYKLEKHQHVWIFEASEYLHVPLNELRSSMR